MNYIDYIKSPLWDKKRKARLEIDKYQCRICGSTERLEVHHKPSSYSRLGHESVEDDLTTLCKLCHDINTDAIRRARYKGRKYEQTPINSTVQKRKEVRHGLENVAIQTDIIRPAANAQRADSRPNKQMVEITKADFIKADENRRRL